MGGALALTTSVTMLGVVGWRAKLLWARTLGEFQEIPLVNFVMWLRPRSPVSLYPLIATPHVPRPS